MTNPTVNKTVLADGTVSNYQDCVAEEASIYPLSMVYNSSDHSPNGAKLTDGEDPAVNTNTFKIGVVEIEEIRIDSTEKYDKSTAYSDNGHILVHWLKPGDIFYAIITDPAATLAIGSQLVLGAGVLKKPDAVAAFDINIHIFAVERAAVTTDTIVKARYIGFGPADAA
jgi:hypothetical protein